MSIKDWAATLVCIGLGVVLYAAGWLAGYRNSDLPVAAIRADLSEQGCVLTWQDEGDGAHWRVWCEEAQQ